MAKYIANIGEDEDTVQELVPYNLAFLPADIEDQEVDRGTLYSVIDRHLTFVDPDRV